MVLSRANYARSYSLLKAINAHPELTLCLVAGGSLYMESQGNGHEVLVSDGFIISHKINLMSGSKSPVEMAIGTGNATIQIANVLEETKPDIVVTIADRYETMATALSASYMNIPLLHVQGGEISGSIDESVRHAITKLSHLHAACTVEARNNLIQMGEPSDAIRVTGCPAMDILDQIANESLMDTEVNGKGVGAMIDLSKSLSVIVFHPVTTDYQNSGTYAQEIIEFVADNREEQFIWLWPNIDSGADAISKSMRKAREHGHLDNVRFVKNYEPAIYGKLLKRAQTIIGNSSSGIREASYIGLPSISIGTRQQHREVATNVIFVAPKREDIQAAYYTQKRHGKYTRSTLYGSGNAGSKIAEFIAESNPIIQKVFNKVRQ